MDMEQIRAFIHVPAGFTPLTGARNVHSALVIPNQLRGGLR